MNDFLLILLPTPMMLPPKMVGVSAGAIACGVDMESIPAGFCPLALAPGWPVGFGVPPPNDEPPPKDDPPNEDGPKEETPNDELPKLDPDPCAPGIIPTGVPNPPADIPDPPGTWVFKLPISWPLGPT